MSTIAPASEARITRDPAPRPAAAPRALGGPSGREVVVATGLLLVLTAAVFGPYMFKGGFLSDDWATYARVKLNGVGMWGDYRELVASSNLANRPGGAAYYAFFMNVFGNHMGVWLAWIAALGAVMSASLYALLRVLRVARVPAFATAALVLLIPAADTLRLWPTGGTVQVPITLTIVGFILTFLAFRSEGRRALALHAGALVLWLVVFTMGEHMVPFIFLSVFAYRLEVPWRRAVRRWAVDLVVLLPLVVWVVTNKAGEGRPIADWLQHGRNIGDDSLTLLQSEIVPIGLGGWTVVAIAAAVVVLAGVRALTLPREAESRPALRVAVALALVGVIVIVLGYVPYFPAPDWYSPILPETGNRTNAVSAFGWILTIVGVVWGAAHLVGSVAAPARRFVPVAAAALLALLGLNYVDHLRHDQRAYEQAFTTGQETLATMKRMFPAPPKGATVYVFMPAIEVEPGVPIFNATWDLMGAAQVLWGDPSIKALPVMPAMQFDCRRTDMDSSWGPGTAGFNPSKYGETWMLNVTSGEGIGIANRRDCRVVQDVWQRPAWLSGLKD